MVISHNIAAMNARKNFSANNKKLQKNLEKLSSGYRINRAADDASGLAVSQAMRMILVGTAQAQDNVADGIGLIQTAEGAMDEIHSMLNRAYELSERAANGTYEPSDRAAMEDELTELKSEINRITETSNFNGIELLKGDEPVSTGGVSIDTSAGLPSWVGRTQGGSMSETYTTQETYKYTDASGQTQSDTASIDHAAASLDFSQNFDKNSLIGKGFYSTCCTCNNHYSIAFTNSTTSEMVQSGKHYIFNIGIANVNSAPDLVQAIVDGTNNGYPNNHYTRLVTDNPNTGKLIIYDDRSSAPKPSNLPASFVSWDSSWKNPGFNTVPKPQNNRGLFDIGIATSSAPAASSATLQLQIGPTSTEFLKVLLPNTTLKALNIESISVSTQDSSLDNLSVIKDAIIYLNGERGRMGAYQNTLEHRENYLEINSENLTASESRIRDVDMAKEMTKYIKNNILHNSSMSALQNSKLLPQNVLQLITG